MTMTSAPPPCAPAPPPAAPLQDILTPAELALLRSRYNRDCLARLAPRMIPWPKAAGFVGWTSDVVFTPGPGPGTSSLTHAEREMVIVAVMVTQRDTVVLSGHLYWALMEGLSVEKIADTLMTVATYQGVNALRYGLAVLRDVLLLLKDAVRDGKTTVEELALELRAEFGAY
jgi:alkylhydroperoxidase/carboxymuconolactone decarboxylase family protein YurZ